MVRIEIHRAGECVVYESAQPVLPVTQMAILIQEMGGQWGVPERWRSDVGMIV